MEAAQREIATILPPRDQYIVTTSEFDMVKARLLRIENRQKVQNTKSDKPTLRTRTERQSEPPQGQAQPGAQTGTGGDTSASSTSSDDPDRPVLKKRTEAPDNSGTNGSGTSNSGGATNNGGTNNGSGGGGSSPSSTPSATPSTTPSSTPSTTPNSTPSTTPSSSGTPSGGGTNN